MYYANESFYPDTNEYKCIVRILDDKTLPDKTLSRRRLKIQETGVTMQPLSKAVFMLGDFIRLAKSHTWWIDSNGKVFNYRKTQFAKLTCHKILRVIPGKATGAVLEVEGIAQRFKSLFIPDKRQKYALVLHMGMMTIFYGTSEEYQPPTRRKV